MQPLYKSTLIASALIFGSFAFASPEKPKMFIKQIKNNTGVDLVFVDRFNKGKKFRINAEETKNINFEIKNSKNVILSGSIDEVLPKYAQFAIKVLDNEGKIKSDMESYLNMNLLAAGENDESAVRSSIEDSMLFKFCLGHKRGGLSFRSKAVNEKTSNIEITLVLSLDEEYAKKSRFKLDIEFKLNEK